MRAANTGRSLNIADPPFGGSQLALRMKRSPPLLAPNRFDESFAPPVETDDCGVDRRPARGTLRARSAEMLVEKGKDLVPAVDRLLRPVIRAIMRKKRVAGAVIPVEFVILAVLLQLRLGAVDLVGRRVRVLVAEQTQQRAY